MTLHIVFNAFLLHYYFGGSLRQVIIEKHMVKEKHKLKNTKSYPTTVPGSHLKVAFFVHTDTRKISFLTLFRLLYHYFLYTHLSHNMSSLLGSFFILLVTFLRSSLTAFLMLSPIISAL